VSAAAAYVCRQFVEDVTDYLEGTLPAGVVAAVEAHLADCPHCREYLAQLRASITGARALDERDVDAMPDDVRERLLRAFRERET
jgi:anti-sigma factor RsiW